MINEIILDKFLMKNSLLLIATIIVELGFVIVNCVDVNGVLVIDENNY